MTSYQDAITLTIQKEMEILGEEKAIDGAREVDGLEIDEEGNVEKVKGDGFKVLNDLVESYEKIGGTVTASLIARELRNRDLENLELPEELSERM